MQNLAIKTPIDRIFDEGVALTLEARNYIAFHQPSGSKGFDNYHTRVSARLIQIMTWLLTIRAVSNGEITQEQFRMPAFALGGGPECTDESGHDIKEIPQGLRSLLKRTYILYMRVLRLDEQVHGQPVYETDQTKLIRMGITVLRRTS